MPGMNGMGPLGYGPRTGRGLGPCGRGVGPAGAGVGRGFRRGGFGAGRGLGYAYNYGYNLRDYKNYLEEELKAVNEELGRAKQD